MKNIRTTFFIIISVVFASCDNSLVSPSINVSADKTTVTKGSEITFSISGDAEYIMFYSGETGKKFLNRNRTSVNKVAVAPDKCVGIKHYATSIHNYSYKFNTAGKFTTTFVGRDADGDQDRVKEIVITVTE